MLPTSVIGSGPRIALLHGFTQTRTCWAGLDRRLADRAEVVTVDLPGHGQAGRHHAGFLDTVTQLAETVGPATWLGYSMGGRHALALALEHPELVEGLILIGSTAGIEDEAQRRARLEADTARAARLVLDGVDAFLDDWLAGPLFAGLAPEARHEAERRSNTVEGLAASLILAGTGAQPSLWDRLGRGRAPLAVLVGETDTKFAALGQKLTEAWGGPSRRELIPGAGHAAHLECPQQAATLIESILIDWGR